MKKCKDLTEGISRLSRVCLICLIVLFYVVTILSGLLQMLEVYVIELNVEYARSAVEISESLSGLSTSVSYEDGIVISKVPMGTGSYYCRFEDNSVMFLKEMDKDESVRVVSVYFIFDGIAFGCVLHMCYLCSKSRNRPRLLLNVALGGVLLLLNLVSNCYCYSVLFGSHSVEIFEVGVKVCFMLAFIYIGEDYEPNPFRSL